MFGWFKKKLERCHHYKGAGESGLSNMVEVLRFYEYESDKFGYGISECKECGVRAFSCMGLHLLGTDITDAVDSFIGYTMTLEQLKCVLGKRNFRCEIKQKRSKIKCVKDT